MARIRRWAAVAAFLALSAASAPACQLSLVGAVTQDPLTYNPFQAGAGMAVVSFTLQNAGGKPCNAAFAFFKAGPAQASAGGSLLAYQLLSAYGGLVTQIANAPPAVLGGGNAASTITVGAKQTLPVKAAVSVAGGQVVGPGVYTDQLVLGVYQNVSGHYAKAVPDVPLNVAITVNSQMTLSVAGGGRTTTLNFGDFVEGAKRSVQLLVYANQGFHLMVSSDNGGVMVPVDATAKSEGQWRVPYTVTIFRTAAVDLAQQRTISMWPTATQRTGLSIPIEVQIGSTKGQRAGIYRDVITIAIDPGP